MPFGDEIAVLDGLDGLGALSASPVEDGRIGTVPATGGEYARQRFGVESRRNVIDASEGANYSGGSSYAPGLPLLPSSIGLAGFADDDLMKYMQSAGVLPTRRNVIDPSMGANYQGGSSYAPGIPLLPSRAGLAGLGRVDQYSDFGRADDYSDFDGCSVTEMDRKFSGLAGSSVGIDDGRIGRTPATGAEYARQPRHGIESRRNVIDASEGANYSGGSSYAPGLPLLPSSVGLAELSVVDVLDGLSDNAFAPKLFDNQKAAFARMASNARIRSIKQKAQALQRVATSPRVPYPQRQAAFRKLGAEAHNLKQARRIRRNILETAKQNTRRARAQAQPVRQASM